MWNNVYSSKDILFYLVRLIAGARPGRRLR